MPNIIGLTDTTKILNSASLSRSDVGMQTLAETYTVTEGGLDYFCPKINDPHPVFPTLACVSSQISPLPGSLRTIAVSWVGLIEAGSEKYVGANPSSVPAQPQIIETLPPPLITTIAAGTRRTRLQDGGPIPGSTADTTQRLFDLRELFGLIAPNTTAPKSVSASGDWIEFPYIVNISFVSPATDEEERNLFQEYSVNSTLMPAEFRGVQLPKYPEPYQFRTQARRDYGAINPAVGAEMIIAIQVYYGVCLRSISIERQGYFNIVYLSFGDLFEIATQDATFPVG